MDDGILRFWQLATRLKSVRRQGWIDRGVREPESDADHSWGVALLAWLLARDKPDLDRDRVLLLGLVHDLPEALAGDATPFDALRRADGTIESDAFRALPVYSDAARARKHNDELRALNTMLGHLPMEIASDIRTAWLEYDAGTTEEARFVRQVDKLETLLQATEYQREQPELVIESFLRGTRRDVTDPHLAKLIARVREWT